MCAVVLRAPIDGNMVMSTNNTMMKDGDDVSGHHTEYKKETMGYRS